MESGLSTSDSGASARRDAEIPIKFPNFTKTLSDQDHMAQFNIESVSDRSWVRKKPNLYGLRSLKSAACLKQLMYNTVTPIIYMKLFFII